MPVKLKIKVTKEVLEKTKDCSEFDATTNCAIAYAIVSVLPRARVFQNFIIPFYDSSQTTTWNDIRSRSCNEQIILPKVASSFIKEFDSLDQFARPFMPELEFEIEIPDEVINQINIDEIRPLLINHPTLELIQQ